MKDIFADIFQVTAMVERVVKRQAELGVDIVTDGEGALLFKFQIFNFQISNFQFSLSPRWEERATTCTF